MTSSSFQIVAYLYWLLLILVTTGSLIFAVFAFRLHRQQFATISAGGLAAALLIASVPAPGGASVFGTILGMLALGLAVVGGGPAALLALRLATHNSVTPGQHGGILVENGGAAASDPGVRSQTGSGEGRTDQARPEHFVHEVLRGGQMIGILERLAVAGAILAGFPEALAIVVAIKGVGRFTELAAAEARERFIIGTLASLIWACACAALVQIAVA